MHWDPSWHTGWHVVWMIGFWVVLIALAAFVFTRLSGSSGAGRDDPERILKRRYARGEMNREEYERQLEDLRR